LIRFKRQVNVMPSLASTSEIDRHIKNHLMSDLNHLLGFIPYDRKQFEKDNLAQKERQLVYGKNHDEQSVKRRNLFEMAATNLEQFEEDELEVKTHPLTHSLTHPPTHPCRSALALSSEACV